MPGPSASLSAASCSTDWWHWSCSPSSCGRNSDGLWVVKALAQWFLRQLPPSVIQRALASDQARLQPVINELFFTELLTTTRNFGNTTWLGHPIWQNVLDLWTIQETIVAVKPDLLIECGSNRRGSAFFFAQLFDLLDHGRVISIDIEQLSDLMHPRATFLVGSSVDPVILRQVESAAASVRGPIMVILDSNHTAAHVAKELEVYHRFVTSHSYLLVQDGVIDTLPLFQGGRPGPLPAIQAFLQTHPEFSVDRAKSERFLITHHPDGWLQRR
jgi:cephalosporin hydroxylase